MRIQVTAIISTDGYLAKLTDSTRISLYSGKYGWERLKEQALPLFPHSSLIALLDERRRNSDANYLVEATPNTMGLIKGMLLYRLADEFILYILPQKQEKGIQFSNYTTLSEWKLAHHRLLKGGIQREVYLRSDK